jgi:hypothetical protein
MNIIIKTNHITYSEIDFTIKLEGRFLPLKLDFYFTDGTISHIWSEYNYYEEYDMWRLFNLQLKLNPNIFNEKY